MYTKKKYIPVCISPYLGQMRRVVDNKVHGQQMNTTTFHFMMVILLHINHNVCMIIQYNSPYKESKIYL